MVTAAHGMAASRAFLHADDVDAIISLVSALPKRRVTVVDIGAGAGTTALAILETRSTDITVFTIDVNHENLNWARLALANVGLCDNWISVYQPSARRFLQEVDLLLVDGDHSYEGVRDDLAAWLPSVLKGFPVWLDDYHGEYPGVARAVSEAPLRIARHYSQSVACFRA